MTIPALLYALSPTKNRVSVYFSEAMTNLATDTNFTIAGLVVVSSTPAAGNASTLLVTTGMIVGDPYIVTVASPPVQSVSSSDNLVVNTANFTGALSFADPQPPFAADALLDAESTFIGDIIGGIPVPEECEPQVRYMMRAFRALTPGHVHWLVVTTPDFAAAQAPYLAVQLTDIVVEQVLPAA